MAWNNRPAGSVQRKIDIIVDASYVINGMKPNMSKTMLEGENSDLWQLIYDEYDKHTNKTGVHQD